MPRRGRYVFIMSIFLLAWFFVWINSAAAAGGPPITVGNISSAFNNWKLNFFWPHTVSGNDSVLMVTLHTDGYYINSVSYAGQAMILAGQKVHYQSYNNIGVYVFYLANPAPGANNIEVTTSFSVPIMASAVTFNNCDTANPIGAVVGSYDVSRQISHGTTTAANSLLVDAVTYNKPPSVSIAPASGQTQSFANQIRGQTNDLYFGESYKSAQAAGWQAMGWGTGDSRPSVQVITVLNSKYKEELEPVILVPGIMGSDLINASDPNDKIWLDTGRLMGSWSDEFLDYLKMDNDGNTINAIKVGDAIREIKVTGVYNADVLRGLISYLQTNGYQENENLFVFPYDWRQRIGLTAFHLNQKISDILAQTGSQKVNIIAHSLGGLVTKDYMKKYADQNKINKFIDIATPHLGAPKAFKVLKYGDNLGVKVILNENRVKIISQNMPSLYELLPSAAYYDSGHVDYNFIYSDQGHNYDYEDVNSYLRIWNNPVLVNEAKEFHNNIDDYDSYASSTRTYNIIGCGFATIGKIIKLNQEKDHNEYLIDYVNGDGTVPLKSAEGIRADEKYYYDGAEHMSLSSANGVPQLVSSILGDKESQFDLSPYPMSVSSNICQIRGKLVSYHSPIALHVYDENGSHIGPNPNGDIENQIPGAQYDIIEDNKFVFLPSGHIYRVEGQATGLGTFNSRVETIDNGVVTNTAYYNQVPITTANTNVEMTVMDNQTDYTMKIDQDGDKTFEATAQPSSMLDEQGSGDVAKPETTASISGTKGNDDWYLSPVQILLTASDGQSGSGILKTEYSLDEGQTWQAYSEIINIDKQGANKILFKSTDRAGNIEEDKTSEFKIDFTPPAAEMIAPLANDEYDHAESLEILYNNIDNISGLDELATKIQIDGQNISTTSVDLFPYHLGNHQLVIQAADLAGNQIATTVPFFIITSITGTIDDINRLSSEKQIVKASVKDELIDELDSLQRYLEKFSDRQDKGLSKYEERLSKCDKRKKVADCRKLVTKLYERQKYVLGKIYSKIIAARFVDLLKDSEKCYLKKWLTPRAHEIIEEELIYLKNNL